MILSFTKFGGIAPAINPALLADNAAQTAQNADLFGGSLRSFYDILTVATPTKAGTKLSIYRFGKDVISDSNYWFTWTQDVCVMRGLVADDASERTYYTGDGNPPSVTDATLAITGGGTDYPNVSYRLGLPAPAAAPTLAPASSSGVTEDRAYVYTYVTAWGEESAPSPAQICTVTVGANVDLSAMSVAPVGNYNVTTKHIYRSVTTSTGTDYFFVGSVAIATTTFTDNVPGESLGEPLLTVGWLAPPADMTGLIALHEGMAAGFHGKEVCICEPYTPYAWPMANRHTVDYDVVGLAALPQSLLILTKGTPYLVSGNDPATMLKQKFENDQACVSRRSIARYKQGCLYASPDGLIYAGIDGSRIVTEGLYRRADWQALNPSSMHGIVHEGLYYGFYNGTAGFVIDPETKDLITFNWYADACHVDPQTDALYFAIGALIRKWRASSLKFNYTWKSKQVLTPVATSFACAAVICSSYSPAPTFKLYADGVLKHTQTVTSGEAFRLPGGFKAKQWEAQLDGQVDTYAIHVAESVQELKGVV
jgi:hypothetical protein